MNGLETVVERLEARGPSGISPPQCWYCGRIEAWFRCDCLDVQAIRRGEKDPPRVVSRDGHMLVILDEETIARNSGRKRYGVPGASPHQREWSTSAGGQRQIISLRHQSSARPTLRKSPWLACP
jgi:hypothetical protein